MCRKLRNEKNDEQLLSKIESLLNNQVSEDAGFKDNFQTTEQKNRDAYISGLLDTYVSGYDNKVEDQRIYRSVLFWGCSVITLLFSILILGVSIYAIANSKSIDNNGIISVITVCVTLLSSIIGLLKTITKFCFPENDEQYITQIVDSIQKNDLEHKKENMRLFSNKSEQKGQNNTQANN